MKLPQLAKLLILVLLFISPIALEAKERGAFVNGDLYSYSHPVIFKDLPDRMEEFKPYFQAIAFVILTAALIFAFKNSSSAQSQIQAITFAALLAMVMATSTFYLQLALNSVAGLNKALDVDTPHAIADRMYTIALSFQDAKIVPDDPDKVDDQKAVSLSNLTVKPDEDKFTLIQLMKDPSSMVFGGIKAITVIAVSFLVHIALVICSIVIIIFEAVRYFLVNCGALIMPIFLAGLMTQSFRSQSITYIFGLLGIICWPLGWSLGHIGTLALFDAIVQTMNGAIITDSDMAHNVIGHLADVPNAANHVAQTAGWVAVSSMGSLMTLAGLVLGIVLWVLVVTFSAPFLIQKVVSSGSQFFSGIAGGTAQMMTQAAGGAASYGMVRTAQATTLQRSGMGGASGGVSGSGGSSGSRLRPSPSPFLRAGFSGARTMMNASRYQGDPSQLSQVFDSGLDEMRQYRSEAAQVDIAQMASDKAREQHYAREAQRAESKKGNSQE